MLSYRHAFHAGNHADVLKHTTLTLCLEYMMKKPAPLMYIDTHSGAGQYSLKDKMAQQNKEFSGGIDKIDFSALPTELASYQQIIAEKSSKRLYPGSPVIAAQHLRKQDKLRFFELHPTDYRALQQHFSGDRRVMSTNADGLAGLKSLLPAPQKRAIVLIDPSYEIKSEYADVVKSIERACKVMENVCILLWYPVIRRGRIDEMIKKISKIPAKSVWQYELSVEQDNPDLGMTASGMIVFNPPWGLTQKMRMILPGLQAQLAPRGKHLVEKISGE